MRDTSLAAFNALKDRLPECRGRVFAAFWAATEALCDLDLVRILGWEINMVTPRRGELVDAEYLVEAGVKVDPKRGREVHYYRLNDGCLAAGWQPKQEQVSRRKANRREKRYRLDELPVEVCARRLAQARRGKKQKPVKRAALPLFNE